MASSDVPQTKPRLLVVLGAGSSMPWRMPGISEINELMKRWSREWAQEHQVDAGHDTFSFLWEATARYYKSNDYGISPNFERILGYMTALASWLSPTPFGNPIIEAIEDGAPVGALQWLSVPSDRYAGRTLIMRQQAFLLEKLTHHMRDLSIGFDARPSEISDYTEFFGRLRERFDLGVYNLNYDTVARSAWPEAYRGFDCHGRFDPSGVIKRREWGFLYHLHGSVHHSIANYGHRIEWKDDLASEFRDHRETAPDMAQEFRPAPLTTLIAGGFKLDQLLADPFHTFHSSLVRHAQEADALLIAGYGFGDLHVNRCLRIRFDRIDDEAAHPKAVVLEKSPHGRLQTASLQANDYRAYQLTHTFNTRFAITEGHRNREMTVAPFIESGELETDNRDRAGIWHGGFREAFAHVGRISDWLSRAG